MVKSIAVDIHTRAMCYHSPCQFFLSQSRQRMESTPYLECADTLIVLTFEEEVDFWPCGCLSFERGTNQGFWRLGCRCKLRKGCRCQNRCPVDMFFDSCVSSLDRRAFQWKCIRNVSHCVLQF